MATYRTRRSGRMAILITASFVVGFLLSIGVDWVGSWL